MSCQNLWYVKATSAQAQTPAVTSTRSKRRSGFTLIELLVVISIISILVALLLPALAKARAKAADLNCLSRIKGANTIFQLYFNDFNEFVPPLAGINNYGWGYNYGTWYGCVAPYAGVSVTPTNVVANKAKALACPVGNGLDPNFPFISYSTPWSIRFKTWGDSKLSPQINTFAKLSETGLLVDNYTSDTIYYMTITASISGYPATPTFKNGPIHGGRGVSVSFMDGHANFIGISVAESTDPSKGVFSGAPIGAYNRTVPFVHRAFYGRYRDGTYAPFSTNYYQYQP